MPIYIKAKNSLLPHSSSYYSSLHNSPPSSFLIPLFLFLINILPFGHLSAQYASTQEYSARDYPFLKIALTLVTAPDGKLWIGTYSDGVSVYDGRNFKNYNSTNGMIQNRGADIKFSYNGSIWIKGNLGITKLDGDNIRNYPYHDLFPKLNTAEEQILDYDNDSKRLVVATNDLKQILQYDFKEQKFIPFEPILCENTFPENFYNSKINSYISYGWNNEVILCSNGKTTAFPGFNFAPYFVSDSLIYFSREEKIFQYTIHDPNPSKPIYQSRNLVEYFKAENNSLFLVERINQNDICILQLDLYGAVLKKCKIKCRERISAMTMDRAGNFWLAHSQGLIKVLPWIEEYNPQNSNLPSNIWGINQDRKNRIWFSSEMHGFRYLEHGIIRTPSFSQHFTRGLNGFVQDSSGAMYFSLTHPAGFLRIEDDNRYDTLPSDKYIFFATRFASGTYAIGKGEYAGLWLTKHDPLPKNINDYHIIDSTQGLSLFNVLTAAEDKYGNIWMGRASQGISVYLAEKDTVLNFLKINDINTPGGISSCTDSYGNVWMGTDQGLIKIDVDTFIQSQYNFHHSYTKLYKSQIGESTVGSLIIHKGKIILGNQEGIAWFSEQDAYKGNPYIYYFNRKAGYNGGGVEQNVIFVDRQEKVWVSNTIGVLGINLDEVVKDTLAPEIGFHKLCIEDSCYYRPDDLVLPIGVHTVDLHFYLLHCPYLYDNVVVQYNLNNTGWNDAKSAYNIHLQNLSPGKYNLKLRAIKNSSIFSSEKSFSWQIQAHWWQNKTFLQLFTLILTALSLLLIFNVRSLNQKNTILIDKESHIAAQNAELKTLHQKEQAFLLDKMNLQVQAIVNQLNPHFIKNVLAWMQVKTVKDKEATKVLGALGNNIEIIFRNSKERKPYHSLGDELTLVQNYLYIQQARYAEKLHFHTTELSSQSDLLNVQVPLLSILTHVENAAEHGLKNLNDGGTISVIILPEADHIQIIVEDNGVGREAARIAGSQGTQQGVQMLRSLIEIYNAYNTQKMSMIYEDDICTNTTGKKHGTRVRLHIPYHYKFEI